MLSIKFKRGDTFVLEGQLSEGGVPTDMTGWTVKAQVRQGATLLAELTVAFITQATGHYRLTALPTVTQLWPATTILADVQYTTASGQVVSTETFEINCQADVTYA